MNINTRLHRLENKKGVDINKGIPLRPEGLTDEQFSEAIQAKRRELKLKPSDPLHLFALLNLGKDL